MTRSSLFRGAALAVLAAAAAVGGCALFTQEKVQVPPRVAKALELAPAADGPDKGKVMVTPDQAAAIKADYDAKLQADEAKAKQERDEKVQAAKDKADEAARAATIQVQKTKKNQARQLQQVLDAQSDELDAIAESVSEFAITQLNAQKLANSKAQAALDAIAAERESSSRAFAAADADQKAREERRLGVLNTGVGLATTAAQTVGGPYGAAAIGGIGLLAGWLGLSKPGDKKKIDDTEDKAAKLAGTVQTIVKAVDTLPEGVKPVVQQAVAAISTPADEVHITEAKAVLKT